MQGDLALSMKELTKWLTEFIMSSGALTCYTNKQDPKLGYRFANDHILINCQGHNFLVLEWEEEKKKSTLISVKPKGKVYCDSLNTVSK